MKTPDLRRIAAKDDYLGKSLNHLWLKAAELQWAQQGATVQDQSHCERVEKNIYRLFVEAGQTRLCSPVVAYILSAAAALHDIGKIQTVSSSATKDHGVVGQEEVLSLNQDWFPDEEFQHIIAGIVGAHANGGFRGLGSSDRVCREVYVWPRSLAAVFRLADMLDVTSIRTPRAYCTFGGIRFEKNRSVWLARGAVTSWSLSDDHVFALLQARPRLPEAARAVLTLVQLTNKDIGAQHRAALKKLSFSRAGGGRDNPNHFRLPGKLQLQDEDRRRVKSLAKELRHGYWIGNHEIRIAFGAAVRVTETLTLELIEKRDSIEIPLSTGALRIERVVCGQRELDPTHFSSQDMAIALTKSFAPNARVVVEIEYTTVEREVNVVVDAAPRNGGILVDVTGSATALASVTQFDKKERTSSPGSAEMHRADGHVEFRIAEPDHGRIHQIGW